MHPVFTHRGWLGLCPVYIGNLESDSPLLMARRPWLEWLLTASTWGFHTVNIVCSALNPNFEPGFPIRVTGRIDQ